MKKILAIGNSFSMNATQYFNPSCKIIGLDFHLVNLYIPGCSLEMHWNNYNDNTLYELQIDAKTQGFTSLKEALNRDQYDIITLQQASDFSGMIDKLYPYFDSLIEVITYHQPNATIMYHQTWSYDYDSNHRAFVNYDKNSTTMIKAIKNVTDSIKNRYHFEIIPTGQAMQMLRVQTKDQRITKDGYHLKDGIARIIAALVWIKTFHPSLSAHDIQRVLKSYDLNLEELLYAENIFNNLDAYKL